jgi:hypothetical protein
MVGKSKLIYLLVSAEKKNGVIAPGASSTIPEA